MIARASFGTRSSGILGLLSHSGFLIEVVSTAVPQGRAPRLARPLTSASILAASTSLHLLLLHPFKPQPEQGNSQSLSAMHQRLKQQPAHYLDCG